MFGLSNLNPLNLSQEEAYTLVMPVATEEISEEELSAFLQKPIQ